MTLLRTLAVAALAAAALSTGAFAQTAAPAASAPGGPGRGPGMGPGGGMGPGMGHGWRAGPRNTPGWSMMTPEERAEHQKRMQSMTSRADCTAYMDEHHRQMVARAQQRGSSAPAQRRRDVCARLQ